MLKRNFEVLGKSFFICNIEDVDRKKLWGWKSLPRLNKQKLKLKRNFSRFNKTLKLKRKTQPFQGWKTNHPHSLRGTPGSRSDRSEMRGHGIHSKSPKGSRSCCFLLFPQKNEKRSRFKKTFDLGLHATWTNLGQFFGKSLEQALYRNLSDERGSRYIQSFTYDDHIWYTSV